jgi:predicted RNA-binding Zn-ribbon protein involved in translation (DUF1610 family)
MNAPQPITTPVSFLSAETMAECAAAKARIAKTCPKCGSDDMSRRHHAGNMLAPECHWLECNECGYESDPS